MTKATYQRVVSLSEADNKRVARLQELGVKVIEIFRAGLIVKEMQITKELKKKGGE